MDRPGRICPVSATLQANGLSAGHAERTLFADLDLTLAPSDVIGLVGVNGAGKSTLLRMLAGGIPDEGTITLSPPDATVGYLAQEPERADGETVLGFLARRTGVAHAQQVMDTAAERLGDGGADDYSPRSSTGSPSVAPISISVPRRSPPTSASPITSPVAWTPR